MERIFYVIESKWSSRLGSPSFEVAEGRLPETWGDAKTLAASLMFGDDLDQITAIRITRVDWDIPPQDVTEEIMTAIAQEWAEEEWPYRRILSDYGYDEFAEQFAREVEDDRAHIRAELAKRT